MVSIVDWHVVKSTIICNCYWILLCINCLDWRPRWITPSKICFIIHFKYFQLKKMLYTLINEKLPSSQYYWNDEYINFRYWKSGMKDIKCKEDHHSRSLHIFLYSAVPIYTIHMFIISSLPFLGILQTNLMTWLPVGLLHVAQSVSRVLSWYRKGQGSNLAGPECFSGFLFTT